MAGFVLAVALAFVACNDGVGMIGDAMVDAGEAVRDAGGALRDAAPDAAAQQQVTVNCDRQEGASWYAEAAVTIDPDTVQSVSAVLCDKEGSFTSDGGLPCQTNTVLFSASRVRTFCGGGDPAAGGYRYRSVRFVIR